MRAIMPVRFPSSPRTSVRSHSGLPIQMRAEDLRSQRLEFALRSAPQRYLADVIANVEVGIGLPARQTNVEWRKYHPLAVARNHGSFDSTKSRHAFSGTAPSKMLTHAMLSGWPGRSM